MDRCIEDHYGSGEEKMKRFPAEVPSDNDYVAFRRYHTHRLHWILQHHSVSKLLDKVLPAEYLHLTRNLCNEERRGLSAAYKSALRGLSEILERSKVDANPVSSEQEKNIKLALSILHRSVWHKARRPDEEGDNRQAIGDRG